MRLALRRSWLWLMCAGLCLLAFVAQAADRRFVPVPKPPLQRMDVISGMPIVSAAGKAMEGGASMRGMGTKQAELLVSFRNSGKVPVELGPQAVVASAAGGVLALREAAPPASRTIAPGQTLPMQYLLDLPKPVRSQLATLTVTVELGGERLVFEFQEIQ